MVGLCIVEFSCVIQIAKDVDQIYVRKARNFYLVCVTYQCRRFHGKPVQIVKTKVSLISPNGINLILIEINEHVSFLVQ